MSRLRVALPLSAWVLLALPLPIPASPPAIVQRVQAADGGPAEDEEEEEDEGLRQRLTEREDKRRPARPWSTEVRGRPLTLSGEYEIEIAPLERWVLGGDEEEDDRVLLAQQLELEAFYTFGPPLSLFGQLRLVMEQDLLPDTFEKLSDYYVERGEMWLYSEDIAGSRLNLDVGRLDFEDERRWWWDVDLDAVRLAYETDTLELVVALARELYPERSDRSWVEPEDERVLRLAGEVGWDWRENHALELFALYHSDRSRTEQPGDRVRTERADDSDARLTWLGARLTGAVELPSRGFLGYWLDAALVRGEERLLELEEISRHRSEVVERTRRDVRGWGVDAGASWILPAPLEPRLFAGYAVGSGDSTPGSGSDRSFRQTGLQANEAGFGGVERFPHYGVVLDPELSNLAILTVGGGLSLLRSSSLDLVYHRYRQVERAPFLRDARLEATPTGASRDIGQGADLVLAIEEWEHLELELILAAFRAGRAFGDEHGTWSYGGMVAVRWAF